MAETDLDEPRDEPKPDVDPIPDPNGCDRKPKPRKPRTKKR